MVPRVIRIAPFFWIGLAFCALLLPGLPLRAQRPTGGAPTQAAGQRSSSSPSTIPQEMPVDVLASVREPTGMPLASNAVVKLVSVSGLHLTTSTQENSTATFPRIFAGEYDIEVTALGHKTATELPFLLAALFQTRVLRKAIAVQLHFFAPKKTPPELPEAF